MEFRKADESDLISVMKIIRQAQDYFKANGIDQWQDNYPDLTVVMNDIIKNYGFVLLKDGNIVGTAAISFDGEKTYDLIYEGQWISNDKYAVIHRMAVATDHKGKGLAAVMFKFMEEICLQKGVFSIKADTHSENMAMQKALKKNGFQYCGTIYLEDKNKRMAYEKVLA